MTGTDVVYVTYRGREFMLGAAQDDEGLYGLTYYEKDRPENQRSDDIQWVFVYSHGLHIYRNRVDMFSSALDDLLVYVDNNAEAAS